MLEFTKEYMGTIVVSILLAVGIILAVRKMCRDKKAGKKTCGGNCAGCMNSSACHNSKKGSDN